MPNESTVKLALGIAAGILIAHFIERARIRFSMQGKR